MASCPKCGFDLNAEGICPVCGYGRAGEGASSVGKSGERSRAVAGSPKGTGRSRKAGGPARVALIVVGVVALCAVVVVAILSIGKLTGSGRPVASTHAPSRTVAAAAKTASDQGSADGATAADQPKVAAPTQATTAKVSADTSLALYRFPVGASPVSLRASKPIDLYDPAVEPVYNITKRTAEDFPPITSEDAYVQWMLAHTNENKKMLEWRWQRAEKIVERGLVLHKDVLMAFLLTPREWFDRPYNYSQTYANTALPIGYGQTISGPDLVAHMTDELDVHPNDRVLEIGTGSGYQSAVLSQLTNYSYTIEIVKPLAEETNGIYLEHTKEMPEYANIHRRLADGYYGWPRYAPFDRIIVTTGIDHIPPVLLRELKPGGIMLIPIGPPSGQVILKITKTVGPNGNIHLTREDIYHGFKREIFVPFTASGGGTHDTGAKR